MLLHGLDEIGGVDQALVGAGIEPGEALAEQLDMEPVILQIDPVQVGDLIFSAGRGLEALGVFHDLFVIEIEAGHAVVALGPGRLLLDGDRVAVRVELDDAEALRIVHIVAEYGRPVPALGALNGGAQSFFQAVPRENIVAQDHGGGLPLNELLADREGLGQAVRRGLRLVGQVDAELMAVPQ